MIPNPTAKGKRSEAIILATLVGLEKSVLIPWNELRYDLALDDDGRLVRIQCKTGHVRDGCVRFKMCVADLRRPNGDGGYGGQIDAFAVYCPQNGGVYLIPIEDITCVAEGCLRLDPPRNSQTRALRWARDYEIARFPPG
jgi:hypothetical protein